MHIRKPYERERTVLGQEHEPGPGADQAHAGSTDINRIVAQYVATGSVTHVSGRQPLYGDFFEAADLHTQLNRVRTAQEHFEALPARIRRECNNDPVQFLQMVATPEGRESLKSLGLDVVEGDDQAEANGPIESLENPAQDSPSPEAISEPNGEQQRA